MCFERATLLPDTPSEAHLRLGYVRRAQRRYADAIDAFRQALDGPVDSDARVALDGLADIYDALDLVKSIGANDDSPHENGRG